MVKLLFTYCLTLLVSMSSAQSADTLTISGTVISLNTGKPIPDGTLMLTRKKVLQCDSLGHFTISNLSHGQHTLTFAAAGFKRTDTTIFIGEKNITDFRFNVFTDCSSLQQFSKLTAEKDIAEGKAKLLLFGSIAPTYYFNQDKFEKKYKVFYYDFGCTPDLEECILAYNKIVFAYLDKKYGDKWRKEVRQDVVGFMHK